MGARPRLRHFDPTSPPPAKLCCSEATADAALAFRSGVEEDERALRKPGSSVSRREAKKGGWAVRRKRAQAAMPAALLSLAAAEGDMSATRGDRDKAMSGLPLGVPAMS